jgi:Predicted esterase of the alpha-beta hydrolase superfamily
MMNNKKIGLALSGGGALGVAHIGAIEEIEKAGIKVDYICGVSSGAIIGLAYAAGGLDTLHKFYEETLANFAQRNRFIFAKGPDAAFKYIESALRMICAGKDFPVWQSRFPAARPIWRPEKGKFLIRAIRWRA